MNNYSLGQRPVPGFKYSSGIGYIAIPTDISRDKFITMCYQNLKVSIWTEDGGFTNQCPISYRDLNDVVFPDDPKQLGSPVVYVLEHVHNQLIIVKVLDAPGQLGDNAEGQMRYKKVYKTAFAEMTGSAKKGFLGLNLTTDKDAQFFINVRSKNHNASYNTEVDGNINTFATKQVSFQQNQGFLLKTLDSGNDSTYASFSQSTSQNSFKNDKFSINDGQEPFILGNKLQSFLQDFIDEVANITVPTLAGVVPILNSTQISFFKSRVSEILSQKAFLDS